MYPVYQQTFSHPIEHNAYQHHHYPSWEPMTPQSKLDSPRPPTNFASWPYTTMSHSNPADCNCCCNHSYPPGYYSCRPPYPYFQPPPQMYYHGPYPPYHDSYPAYFVPPQHYSGDHASHDYNKRGHCCGCPNHICNKAENNSVKIEEQNPEPELKNSDSSSFVQLPSDPHPIVWVPSNQVKDQEDAKMASSESQPVRYNGWIPLDVNSLKNLMQGGEDKKIKPIQQRKTQLPWPLIWMPGHEKPEEPVKDLREVNSAPKTAEGPAKFKIIPLKFLEDGNRGEKPAVLEDDDSRNQGQHEVAAEKETKTRIILVKQVEESTEKKKLSMPEKQELKNDQKKNTVPEKPKEENGVKSSSGEKQSSTKKSSKLPPVCLRVDPLPRRKSSNGSLRSPSPPVHKENERAIQDSKEKGPAWMEKENLKKRIKVVEVEDKSSDKVENENGVQITVENKHNVRESRDATKTSGMKTVKVVDDGKDSEDEKCEEENEQVEKNINEEISGGKKVEKRKETRNLSESDAALIIQSAYRGFEVRRLQPLEKLRQIDRVKERIGDIRAQVHQAEASKQLDSKQRVVIGEIIMNLLLQLDTIQGLHPTVREVRKSVAKELVCLQEKLDSLGCQIMESIYSETMEKKSSDEGHDQTAPAGSCVSTDSSHNKEPSQAFDDKDEAQQLEKEGNVSQEVIDADTVAVGNRAADSGLEEPLEPAPLLKDAWVSSEHHAEHKGTSGVEELLPLLKDASVSSEYHAEYKGISVAEEECPCSDSTMVMEPDFTSRDPLSTSNEYQEVESKDDKSHSTPIEVFDLAPMDDTTDQVSQEQTRTIAAADNWVKVEEAVNEVSDSEMEGSSLEEKKYFKDEVKSEASESGELVDHQTISEDSDSRWMAPIAKIEEEKPMLQVVVEEDKNAVENPKDDTEASSSIFSIDNGIAETAAAVRDNTKKIAEVTLNVIPELTKVVNEVHDETVSPASETVQEKWNGVQDGTPAAQVEDLNTVHCISETALETKNGNQVGTPASQEMPVAQTEDSSWEPILISAATMNNEEKKLQEENKKLREMLEKLLAAGKEQMGVISNLNGRVKDLERKLSQKKRLRVKRHKPRETVSSAA